MAKFCCLTRDAELGDYEIDIEEHKAITCLRWYNDWRLRTMTEEGNGKTSEERVNPRCQADRAQQNVGVAVLEMHQCENVDGKVQHRPEWGQSHLLPPFLIRCAPSMASVGLLFKRAGHALK
ncbi:hypothetical protein LXL04_010793 [Taraxacum kok-saghyz]